MEAQLKKILRYLSVKQLMEDIADLNPGIIITARIITNNAAI